MDDIIENLDEFEDDELKELFEEVESRINRCPRANDTNFSIVPSNLYDEQKMEYIQKIYSLMNLDDLKELLIKLLNGF